MINQFILFVLFSLIRFILNALPAFPTITVNVDFSFLMQGFRLVNQIINLQVVGMLLLAYLSVELTVFIWSFINWLLHKIPGVS